MTLEDKEEKMIKKALGNKRFPEAGKKPDKRTASGTEESSRKRKRKEGLERERSPNQERSASLAVTSSHTCTSILLSLVLIVMLISR